MTYVLIEPILKGGNFDIDGGGHRGKRGFLNQLGGPNRFGAGVGSQ